MQRRSGFSYCKTKKGVEAQNNFVSLDFSWEFYCPVMVLKLRLSHSGVNKIQGETLNFVHSTSPKGSGVGYQDIRPVTTFKATAVQTVTRGYVSSVHPWCWRIFTCAPRGSVFSFIAGLPSGSLQHWPTRCCTPKPRHAGAARITPKVFLRSGFAILNLPHKSEQDVQSRAVPHWAEIKDNPEGYLRLSWHSKSEDGVDCSLLIEHTFERCLAVCQKRLSLTFAILVQEGPPVVG